MPLDLALPGSRLNIKQGRGGFHAQAVSQKTRKKSVSKAAVSKKATASKVLDPKASKKTTAASRVVKGPAAKNSVTKAPCPGSCQGHPDRREGCG